MAIVSERSRAVLLALIGAFFSSCERFSHLMCDATKPAFVAASQMGLFLEREQMLEISGRNWTGFCTGNEGFR